MIVRVLLIKGDKQMQPTEKAWIANGEAWTKQGWRIATDEETMTVLDVEPEKENPNASEKKEAQEVQKEEKVKPTKRKAKDD